VETRNHRKLLEEISSNQVENVLRPAETECDSMGELFKQALTSTRHMRDEIVKGMPLVEAATNLVAYETSVGEEWTSGFVSLFIKVSLSICLRR
jgi:hypothetical protein